MKISEMGRIAALVVVIVVFSVGPAAAFDFKIFKDPDDGAFYLQMGHAWAQ